MLLIDSLKLPITEVFCSEVGFKKRLVVPEVVSFLPDGAVRLPPTVPIRPRLQEAAVFPIFHKLHAELFHKDRVPRVLSVQAVQPLRNPTKVRLVVPLFVPIYVVHNFE